MYPQTNWTFIEPSLQKYNYHLLTCFAHSRITFRYLFSFCDFANPSGRCGWAFEKPFCDILRHIQFFNFRYLFHAFVIVQTEHFCWSIDKNNDGITIQRSKSFQGVSEFYRQKFRTNQKLILVKGEEGKVTLRQLFHNIYEQNLFSNSFKFLTDHCKQFAYSVFNLATTS